MGDGPVAGADGRVPDADEVESPAGERRRPEAGSGGEPPGPDGLPFLGVGLELIRDQLGYGERMADEYGDVGRATVAGRPFYAVNHPRDVERVLVTENDSFVRGELVTSKLENLSPNSLFVSDGERWQAIREVLQPAFFMEQITEYADEIGELAAERTATLEDGERVDAEALARTITIDVLSRTLFGADVRDRTETLERAARAIRRRFDSDSLAVFAPDWVPHPRIWRYRRAVSDLDDLVEELIQARRDDPSAYDDLLATLVDRSADFDVMDHVTLKDNAKGLLVAGHDTTAAALAVTLGLVACNPSVQSRVRTEVLDVVGEPGDGPPSASDLRAVEYTDAVVREALRLYPPAPFIFRESCEPVDVGAYTIPAGVDVSVSPWTTHRDERWWDEPEQFRPARWLDDGADEQRDRPEYAYFPFGGGPRNCIGARFATTELKLTVAAMCQRVTLETPMESMPEMEGGMTLSPAESIELVARPR